MPPEKTENERRKSTFDGLACRKKNRPAPAQKKGRA
jgi:hypothetical protein